MIMQGVSQTWVGFSESVDRSWENLPISEELPISHHIPFSQLLRLSKEMWEVVGERKAPIVRSVLRTGGKKEPLQTPSPRENFAANPLTHAYTLRKIKSEYFKIERNFQVQSS